MVNFPDFTDHGYRVERELGANRAGGRVTYLAVDVTLNHKVVVKQFQFAQSAAAWSEYDSHKREVEVLRGLKHPGIPCYLDSFQTNNGFCIVQEYKAAEPLSTNRSFNPNEIRTIAVKVLEILVYLQNRIPPIIHRDLKPDNILVDDSLNVFLVDFGFARVGDGEVGMSSVVKGTLGFMPPEQLFNRQLTEASDLYGLGMTLICLLTHTKTDEIGDLVDISYKVKFKHLVPKLSFHWVKWLEKMSEPRLKDRFLNAREALKALPNSPLHPPEVQLSHSELLFEAVRNGQLLTQHLEISNSVPEVVLNGRWEVQNHPNDPPTVDGNHHWIRFNPAKFEANQVQCQVEVDTSRLMTGAVYSRTLMLHTNAFPQVYSVLLRVHTAPIPIQAKRSHLLPLLTLFVFVLIVARLLLWMVLPRALMAEIVMIISLGLSLGAIIGLQGAAWTLQSADSVMGARLATITTACFSVPTLIWIWTHLDHLIGSWDVIFSGLIPGAVGGWMVGLGMGITVEKLFREQLVGAGAIALVLITSFLAITLAIGFTTGFGQISVLLVVAVFSMSLASLLANDVLNHTKRIANYRKLERNRIRP